MERFDLQLVEPAPRPSPPVDEWPQVSIRGLMLGTAVLAVAFALLTQFWLIGGVALFLAAVSVTLWNVKNRNCGPARRMMLDLIWGAGMPVVCLILDPAIFQGSLLSMGPIPPCERHSTFQVSPNAAMAYAALGYQIVLLFIWLWWGKGLSRAASFMAGSFFIGAVVSGVIGIVIFPLAGMGCFYYGIGLLGLTPWFTFQTY